MLLCLSLIISMIYRFKKNIYIHAKICICMYIYVYREKKILNIKNFWLLCPSGMKFGIGVNDKQKKYTICLKYLQPFLNLPAQFTKFVWGLIIDKEQHRMSFKCLQPSIDLLPWLTKPTNNYNFQLLCFSSNLDKIWYGG